jgi:GNAT superfamily N-acetyltransferase
LAVQRVEASGPSNEMTMARDQEAELIESVSDTELDDVVRLYQNEWWTRGRTFADTRDAVLGSDLVVAARETGRIIGFARVLSDLVWKALIFDVIVASEARGRGLGERIIERILAHPRLARVRHFELYCLPDMEPFYRRFGFSPEVNGVVLMRRNMERTE